MATRLAKSIVRRVLHDLEGRSGVGNELEMLDDDVNRELKATLAKIVDEELNKVFPNTVIV